MTGLMAPSPGKLEGSALRKPSTPSLEGRGVKEDAVLLKPQTPSLEGRGVKEDAVLLKPQTPSLEGRGVKEDAVLLKPSTPSLEGRGVKEDTVLLKPSTPSLEGRGRGWVPPVLTGLMVPFSIGRGRRSHPARPVPPCLGAGVPSPLRPASLPGPAGGTTAARRLPRPGRQFKNQTARRSGQFKNQTERSQRRLALSTNNQSGDGPPA